jgi:hypothetical protein
LPPRPSTRKSPVIPDQDEGQQLSYFASNLTTPCSPPRHSPSRRPAANLSASGTVSSSSRIHCCSSIDDFAGLNSKIRPTPYIPHAESGNPRALFQINAGSEHPCFHIRGYQRSSGS